MIPMNKYKVLALGLLFLIFAIFTWTHGGDVIGWCFFGPACLYLPIAGYKFFRDFSIIAQARAELAEAAAQPPALPPVVATEEGLSLGTRLDSHEPLVVAEKDRFAGTYMVGVQGSGKSAEMVNMILQDAIAGKPVIVIDAHKDLVMEVLKRLPEHLLKKVFWFNMEDEAFPFGVNVFGKLEDTSSMAVAKAVDRVMHIFEAVWPDVLKQHNLPRYLRAAVITLLANPGMTLVDMRRFLLDDTFRAELLKNVTDSTVLDFWQTQYDDLHYNDRMKRVQPLLGRLELLFMGRSLVRNILGQKDTSIDFLTGIENEALIFLTLPTKSLTQDSRLIGTMVVAQVHATIFAFGDLPAHKRPEVCVYIDEFQNFFTEDIAELFTEARKFGLQTVVSHQLRSQLPEYLRAATLSAMTKLCFRVTHDDAHEMAPFFRSKETTVRPEDIDPHPIKYLLTYPIDDYHIRLFVDRYLRPLQSMRSGGTVDVTPLFGVLTAIRGRNRVTHELWDPTLHLDQLFYEVMTTGNAYVHIPVDIVLGFSGCGYGFYNEWRHIIDKEWYLSPELVFPPSLVIRKPDNTLEWTRRPDDGREELYSFIFCLRQTMMYLAKHPVGKETTVTPSELAQTLVELPNRELYARTGSEVGRIRTDDMAKPIAAKAFEERLAAIQAQTRAKYCTPKDEVEASIRSTQNMLGTSMSLTHDQVTDTPTSRWEEL